MDSDLDPFSDDEVASFEDDASDLPSIDEDDNYLEEVENPSEVEQKNYAVLSESDVKRLQDLDINEVSCVLSIPRVSACLLLIHYEWSVMNVHEAWFNDEERVRKAVGLLKQVGFPHSETLMCDICFDVVSCDRVKSAGCGHSYCIDCYKQYVDTSINGGPDKCLKLPCPQPSCKVAVDGDMVRELASESNKKKYDRFLLRSYVENNKKMKWCPGPGCDYAVSFESDGARTNSFVTCVCYHSFCWSCGEEAHGPVDCDTVNKWIAKNNSESENTSWILAYTKPCPRCKRAIEKNEGCMHMRCRCGFDFCWYCLRGWSTCNATGCNRFTDAPAEKFDAKKEEDARRKRASGYLERYTHYYERWASNDFSRTTALKHLIDLRNVHIHRLSRLYQKSEANFEFIKRAWQQVIECRRALKWSYAYGYYLPEGEEAKKEFFEYTQGEAEAALERLHHCAENELWKYLNTDETEESNGFRFKLTTLTNVTKTYFENLVRALENGLVDVHVKSHAE
ncbi:probable E3 ubiquitin-protein ligase ARI7 [Abrus precatorius]|uniref:RBR-type E3 ubiquitin transferase n=1 Tax=Abrus precatorius TaxID=3816 RepID=A0A8B8LGK2_ABRPR|nr:probable E3 ubiquitin-protein ligase ARI7 [Abrus precatorius]